MRHIDRLREPEKLKEKGSQWLASFLASGKKHPDSSKYAHPSIKLQLESMSHTKCFYCERSLKDWDEEVDHHIEVSVNKNFAFYIEQRFQILKDMNQGVTCLGVKYKF